MRMMPKDMKTRTWSLVGMRMMPKDMNTRTWSLVGMIMKTWSLMLKRSEPLRKRVKTHPNLNLRSRLTPMLALSF